MTRIHLIALGVASLSLAVPAMAHEELGDIIQRKLAAFGPWYTPAEAAFLRSRCGYAVGEELHNTRIEGDVLFCNNGRRVRDPKVKVIARDVTERAETRTRIVMNDPDIRRAIAKLSGRYATEARAAAHAKLSARLAELERAEPSPRR